MNEPLLDEKLDFVNEDHIDAFEAALMWDHDEQLHTSSTTSLTSSLSEPTGGEHQQTKTERISSKSDWYPVNQGSKFDTRSGTSSSSKQGSKSTKSSKPPKKSQISKKVRNEFRSSFAYTILRWPLLVFILSWIYFLTILYVLVRAHVALKEYFFTWTGERRKIRERLRNAKNYDEWVKVAIELDNYLGLNKWSEDDRFSYYDYKTVRLTMNRMKKFKSEGKDQELMIVLQGCLKKNFAGIENRQLYSHRYFGTKKLVSQYNEMVVDCINHIIDSEKISAQNKRKFFKFVSKNYGKTALCLSGGACFAYIHFGIVKALLDNDLIPSIISGTSGGGLIAALTCTRTNEELAKLLVPKLATKITACEDPWYVWLPRWWKTGARFDSVAWARKACFFTRGSTTFQEAFNRTGRRLNISTVPNDPHSPVILCNNVTSPNCIIWSSLLASSAVPGILNPVVLMMKSPYNEEHVEPFSLGSKWRDGSLRTDIPLDALKTHYNVNFSVVSQVNPHISLFFFAPKGTVGRPVATNRRLLRKEKYATFRGGFIFTALEQLLRLEIRKWLQITKTLDLLPHFLEQDWSNIWLQQFSGSITIWPRIKLFDFWNILSDPSESQLEEMIIKGEKCMYPCILFIKHRLGIERAIEKGKKKFKKDQDTSISSRAASSNGAAETIDDEDGTDTESISNDEYEVPPIPSLVGLSEDVQDSNPSTGDEAGERNKFYDDDYDNEHEGYSEYDDNYNNNSYEDEDEDEDDDDDEVITENHKNSDSLGLFQNLFGSQQVKRRNTIY